MDDVLAKVRALLALTTSSNIDEARNAALVMARLIRTHQLIITEGAPGHGTTFPRPVPPKPKRRPSSADVWRAEAEARRREASFQDIKAKFKGYCKGCSKPIKPNTHIYWSKDKGAYHPICFLRSDE